MLDKSEGFRCTIKTIPKKYKRLTASMLIACMTVGVLPIEAGAAEVTTVQQQAEQTAEYTVKILATKDNVEWKTHDKVFSLQQGLNKPLTDLSKVPSGTYGILEDGIRTGATVAVNDADTTVTLPYFTVAFETKSYGAANGSLITAYYGGKRVNSGDILPSGRQLTLTAIGAGADEYTYTWQINGTAKAETASLTYERLSEPVAVTCAVTGSNNLPVQEVMPESIALADSSVSAEIVEIRLERMENGKTRAQVTLPPSQKGLAMVEIPAEQGNVPVIVHEDGTRQAVRLSVIEGDTARMLLAKSCVVEMDSRRQEFDDIADISIQEAIQFGAARDLWQGTASRTFAGENIMNWGMMATLLYRLADEPTFTAVASADGTPQAWSAPVFQWAVQMGITSNIPTARLAPDVALTKEQMLVMLYRYTTFVKLIIPTTASADDKDTDDIAQSVDAAAWAANAITWAINTGILQLGDNGDLSAPITRAQAAVILQRYVNYLLTK